MQSSLLSPAARRHRDHECIASLSRHCRHLPAFAVGPGARQRPPGLQPCPCPTAVRIQRRHRDETSCGPGRRSGQEAPVGNDSFPELQNVINVGNKYGNSLALWLGWALLGLQQPRCCSCFQRRAGRVGRAHSLPSSLGCDGEEGSRISSKNPDTIKYKPNPLHFPLGKYFGPRRCR